MKRLWIITGLATLVIAVTASVALVTITTTVNAANAPSGTHVANGSSLPARSTFSTSSGPGVTCTSSVLGGVGNTNATISLTARYSATVDCTNNGGNLVESHTTTFNPSSTTTVASTKNGQLAVPTRKVSPSGAPGQVCPNPNWTPSIRGGSLTLDSFTYTVTFAGFSGAYITITGP
jgi:hypothetical protein